jgi:hypothetical protein
MTQTLNSYIVLNSRRHENRYGDVIQSPRPRLVSDPDGIYDEKIYLAANRPTENRAADFIARMRMSIVEETSSKATEEVITLCHQTNVLLSDFIDTTCPTVPASHNSLDLNMPALAMPEWSFVDADTGARTNPVVLSEAYQVAQDLHSVEQLIISSYLPSDGTLHRYYYRRGDRPNVNIVLGYDGKFRSDLVELPRNAWQVKYGRIPVAWNCRCSEAIVARLEAALTASVRWQLLKDRGGLAVYLCDVLDLIVRSLYQIVRHVTDVDFLLKDGNDPRYLVCGPCKYGTNDVVVGRIVALAKQLYVDF